MGTHIGLICGMMGARWLHWMPCPALHTGIGFCSQAVLSSLPTAIKRSRQACGTAGMGCNVSSGCRADQRAAQPCTKNARQQQSSTSQPGQRQHSPAQLGSQCGRMQRSTAKCTLFITTCTVQHISFVPKQHSNAAAALSNKAIDPLTAPKLRSKGEIKVTMQNVFQLAKALSDKSLLPLHTIHSNAQACKAVIHACIVKQPQPEDSDSRGDACCTKAAAITALTPLIYQTQNTLMQMVQCVWWRWSAQTMAHLMAKSNARRGTL